MDIQILKVYISEQEMQELALKFMPPDAPVKNLAVRAAADGVRVSGEVQTPMLPVSFESLWRPAVTDGRLTVHLAGLSAAGIPATPLRALVLTLLKDAVKEPFIEVGEEAIVVDVQEFVRRQNLPVALRFDLQAVRCVEGGVEAEAGLFEPKPAPPVVI